MANNFFEIKNGNFTASEKNKVNNVDLVIEKQGEIISLLGPSGIGKTTILRTIAGLQKLSGGKIKLRDTILASDEIHIEPEKRNVALSFQDNSLFPNYINSLIGGLLGYGIIWSIIFFISKYEKKKAWD